MPLSLLRITLLLLAMQGLVACAGTPRSADLPGTPAPVAAPPEAAAASKPDTAPLALIWSRTSAEHRAIFLEVYRSAEHEAQRVAAILPRGTWAVILDADETTLDNSRYQQERARLGLGFSNDSWTEWVRRRAATALPGAARFTARVRQLGGRVVIVTNRAEAVCPETRDNLTSAGIVHDLVLCAPLNAGDKNPRFRAVENGTASPDLPPLRVVMWIGDNIQDFPALSQDVRAAPDSAFAEFGRSYFVLPNPLYGSWERNALPR